MSELWHTSVNLCDCVALHAFSRIIDFVFHEFLYFIPVNVGEYNYAYVVLFCT